MLVCWSADTGGGVTNQTRSNPSLFLARLQTYIKHKERLISSDWQTQFTTKPCQHTHTQNRAGPIIFLSRAEGHPPTPDLHSPPAAFSAPTAAVIPLLCHASSMCAHAEQHNKTCRDKKESRLTLNPAHCSSMPRPSTCAGSWVAPLLHLLSFFSPPAHSQKILSFSLFFWFCRSNS